MYERITESLEEAKEIRKQTGGKITSFLSNNEKGEIITVYVIRYRQLF
jgi:hypothetical protein